jgi:hypothetical protein
VRRYYSLTYNRGVLQVLEIDPIPPPPGDLIGRIILKKKIIKRGKKTKPACILKENKKD